MALNTKIIISAQDRASRTFASMSGKSLKASKNVFKVNSALKSTNSSVMGLNNSFNLLATGGLTGVAFGLKRITTDAISVKIDMDRIRNTLEGVTGTAESAGMEFKFLADEANRLGIQLRPVAQSYARLLASNELIGVSVKDTREIFTSFSEALVAFGATREQSIRVFSALEQISAKSVLSMEELRQQLGEALPGALALGAKAMKLTVSEFTKLVAQGKIASKDFLVPFAREVSKQFGSTAVKGAQLLVAQFNRLENAQDVLKTRFIEGGDAGKSFSDVLGRILKEVADFAQSDKALELAAQAGTTLAKALEGVVDVAKPLIRIISSLTGVLQGGIDVFGSSTLGALAFAAALKTVISGGRAVSGLFGGGRGGQGGQGLFGEEFAKARSGRSVSPEFQQGSLRSRASTGVGATRASGATRAFIAAPAIPFSNLAPSDPAGIKTDGLRSAVRGATRSVKNFGLKAVNGVGRTLEGFGRTIAGLITPTNVLIAGFFAVSKALAEIEKINRINAQAETQSRGSDAVSKLLADISPDLKALSKPGAATAEKLDQLANDLTFSSEVIQETFGLKGDGLKFFKKEADKLAIKIANLRRNVPEGSFEAFEMNRERLDNLADTFFQSQDADKTFNAIVKELGLAKKDVTKFRSVIGKLAQTGTIEEIAELIKPTVLKNIQMKQEEQLKIEDGKTDALKRQLEFLEKTAGAREKEFTIVEEFRKKIKEGQLTPQQATDKLNERIRAQRKVDNFKSVSASKKAILAQQAEVNFIKKNGEEQLFRFKIQQKYNDQVKKGEITQRQANQLARKEIDVAEQRLALQTRALVSSASASTATSSSFREALSKQMNRRLSDIGLMNKKRLEQEKAKRQEEKKVKQEEKKEEKKSKKDDKKEEVADRTVTLLEELVEIAKNQQFRVV